EAYHDDRGLKLPVTVAPYELHLVRLGRGDEAPGAQADALYQALQAAGIEALYDDRDATPGVKFADADLIGIPLRAPVSARSLQHGAVELKRRDQAEPRIVPIEQAPEAVRSLIRELEQEAAARVVSPAFPESEAEG